jgi:multiple sugar transport system permease protein
VTAVQTSPEPVVPTASSRRSPRRRSVRAFNVISGREKAFRYALLIFVLFITIGPFLWQLSTSLKSLNEDIYTRTPHFLPAHPTLSNYASVNKTIHVWSYAENSVVVAMFTVAGNVVGATLAGFALAKLRFRSAKLVTGLFVSTLILPGEVTIVSQLLTVKSMGFGNTLFGVALPGMISMLNVLLMRNAFQAVPAALDDAAITDGASTWQRLWYVALPNVRGMLSAITIFAFVGAWDDFLWPLLVLDDPDKYTLTVGLQYLNGTFSANPRLIAAGTMISFLPIVAVFAALQRFFFKGVEQGAVKG